MLVGIVLMVVVVCFRKPDASFWWAYTMWSAHKDLRPPGPLLAWLGYGCFLAGIIIIAVTAGR
jgi:hypothetical protein